MADSLDRLRLGDGPQRPGAHAGPVDLATLAERVADGSIDTVMVAFADLFGRLVGKRVTGRYFLETVAHGGMHVCDYLLACDVEMNPVPGYALTSWERGYGDLLCQPDLTTLRIVPWLERTAFVLCDVLRDQGGHEHGGAPNYLPVEVSPRRILQRQLERAARLGLRLKGASELEFYLFRDSYEGARAKGFVELETYGWFIEDYHLLQGTKEEWLVRELRNSMEAAGIPIESSKGEWGPGQIEINLGYCDLLEMADRHCLYKQGTKEIAAAHQVAVTFMAKWSEKFAGSSCHLHTSAWTLDGARSLFHDPAAPDGMAPLFRHWIAGQLAHARELALFYAPFVNSYKRLQSASFAPTRVVWSRDNRTAGFRIVGHGASLRVENRMPGADANPYLAFAATIAAGLDGIERELPLGPELRGDGYRTESLPKLPLTLADAIGTVEQGTLARSAFGDDVVDHYLHAARTELQAFAQVVTSWERERHFERT
jgi:glutamine synthetase